MPIDKKIEVSKPFIMDVERGKDVNNKKSVKFKIILLLKTIVHFCFLVHHMLVTSYAGIFLISVKDSEILIVRNLYHYGPAFTTNWNFMFQTIFLVLALLYDLLKFLDKHETERGKKIKYLSDLVFSAMVVPFTLFVVAMFWGLYAIDRELVFPSVFDNIVPFWFNHCVHTNILAVFFLETVLTARRKPINKRLEAWVATFFVVGYSVVYYAVYLIGGVWLYKVFALLNWWQMVLFQCLIFLMSFTAYKIQYPLNRIFHKKEKTDDFFNIEEPVVHSENENGKIVDQDLKTRFKIENVDRGSDEKTKL